MEQCFGYLSVLFGRRSRKTRLKYLVNYKDEEDKNCGVEFENLMLDDPRQPSYGTGLQLVTSQERDYVSKRQYDRIIEEQRKVDEQIDKQLFEEEESLRIEEEAYYEAQKEAARAASMTLSLKERSAGLANNIGSSENRRSLTLEEVEDDFEDFLEEVRSRSIAFRSQYAGVRGENSSQTTTGLPPSFDRGVDGQSSEEDFLTTENPPTVNQPHENVTWDKFTSGIMQDLPPEDLKAETTSLEKRLDPVGNGNDIRVETNHVTKELDKRIEAERMFSITDDDDMGEFVHA